MKLSTLKILTYHDYAPKVPVESSVKSMIDANGDSKTSESRNEEIDSILDENISNTMK